MKPLLLAASLAANAALLIAFAFRPVLAPPAFRGFLTRHFHADEPAVGAAATRSAALATPTATSRADPAAQLWSGLKADDLPTLIARLRAAGFPPSVVREIVRSQLNARYNARIQALIEPDPNTPFWKLPPSLYGADDKHLAEVNQLERERSRLLRDLLKDDFFGNGDSTAAQRRQFGNLSPAKIDALQRIEDDYSEMMTAITAAMKGVTLPEDREKLALLAREKKADLAAVLSPEELADYTMRSSPITNLLRSRLDSFDPTEAEFRAIFQSQQALNDKFPVSMSGGMISSGDFQQRQAGQRQIEDELKATLGEARYADYQRETNSSYQQLSRLAQRDNLPPGTAVQAFNLRDTVAQQSNRIFDDTSLSYEAKQAALQTLAQNTRTQLLGMLGPTSGPAYVKVADQWLATVEKGSAVSFTGTGGMSYMSSASGSAVMVSVGGGSPSYRRLQPPKPNP